jgi:multisubunit Na+/H+ antiporter MnhB subunit
LNLFLFLSVNTITISSGGEKMFSLSISMWYLIAFIIVGILTILYFVLADVADVAVDGVVLFDPAIILTFLSVTSGAGFLLTRFTQLEVYIVLIVAIGIALIFTALVYFFLLVPIRSAEVSLVYTEKSLEGQLAKVLVPIPVDGFGEIMISSINGNISKRATSFHNEEIPYETTVLIIEIKESTAYVVPYDQQN